MRTALSITLVLALAGFVLVMVAGCSHSPGATSPSPSPSPSPGPSPSPSPSPSDDPLAQPPDDGAGLTNVSADLDAVLEHGELVGACDRLAAGASDRKTRLLCGKSMFFYEPFGTGGVPTVLAQFLVDNFPDDVGPGFSRYGMIEDPSSATHLPLGLAPTAKLGGTIDAVAFTCASCHFARLPDGRYAVGAPNHAYDYGRQILALVLLPSLALSGNGSHDPDAIAALQPLVDKLNADASLKNKLLAALLPLAGAAGSTPMMSADDERFYAHWRTGTMDFLIAPLPVDDKVHTVSKISPLWSIPTPAESADAELGWTGGVASVGDFLHDFVVIGGGDASAWPDDKLLPLADYIYSLRAPADATPPDATLAERGRQLFAADGCTDCHGGPRGMGTRLYGYDELGTDAAMADWLKGGAPANTRGKVTHLLKSPRLVGSWAETRFLHDGALDSLDQLFCLAPRPSPTEPAMTAGGHMMTCSLPTDERQALEAYLLSR